MDLSTGASPVVYRLFIGIFPGRPDTPRSIHGDLNFGKITMGTIRYAQCDAGFTCMTALVELSAWHFMRDI